MIHRFSDYILNKIKDIIRTFTYTQINTLQKVTDHHWSSQVKNIIYITKSFTQETLMTVITARKRENWAVKDLGDKHTAGWRTTSNVLASIIHPSIINKRHIISSITKIIYSKFVLGTNSKDANTFNNLFIFNLCKELTIRGNIRGNHMKKLPIF